MASKYKGPKLSELKGSALHKRVLQLASNPATRSKVPTQYLTGNLERFARARATNARLDQPVVPGDSMTNRDLAREANAATAVQYGPQERQLAQQGQMLGLQGRNTGDYYNTYINALRGAQDHAAAISGAVSQRLQDIGTSGQQAATSADTSTIQRMQQDAQARGATVDPKLAAQASQAAQTNRSLSDAQAGTASLIGQTNANYLGALQAAASQGKLQALGANQLAQSNLGQSKQDLAREKGQANLAYRGKRRSEEATNVATSALAGVKVDTAKAASAQKGLDFLAKTGHTPAFAAAHPGQFAKDVAKSKKSGKGRSQEEIDRPYLTKYGLTYEQFKSKVAGGARPKPLSSRGGAANGKDQFGNTVKDRRSANSQFKKAVRLGKVIGGNDPSAILLGLTQKFPTVDDTILMGAAQAAALGHVGPKTLKHLTRRGIKGLKAAPSSQQTTSGGAGTYDKGRRPG